MTTVAEDALRISEVYGPVLQGEGPHQGRPCAFVRLMGCNLSCGWCDSRFTWDPAARGPADVTTLLQPSGLLARLQVIDAPTVVITGGEPLLQQDTPGWSALIRAIHAAGRDVHLETNGTIKPRLVTLHADAIAVSPKAEHAGPHRGHQDPALHPSWLHLAGVHPGVFFKLVVQSGTEVTESAAALEKAGVPRAQIWVMPQGRTRAEIDRLWPEVVEAAAAALVNATTRAHVLAFGEERRR